MTSQNACLSIEITIRFTLLRFDGKLKHYQLFYDSTEKTYSLGPDNENFTSVNDLVAKGLVTLYMESRAGQYLEQQQLYMSGFQLLSTDGETGFNKAKRTKSLCRKMSYERDGIGVNAVLCSKCAKRKNCRQTSEDFTSTLITTTNCNFKISPEEDICGKTQSGAYFKGNVVDDLTPDSSKTPLTNILDKQEDSKDNISLDTAKDYSQDPSEESAKADNCECVDSNNTSDNSSCSPVSPNKSLHDVSYVETPYYEVTRSLRRYNAKLGFSKDIDISDGTEGNTVSPQEENKVMNFLFIS